VPNANIDQVVAAITAGATVIDVRTAEEMAEGMLPGAVPIPHTEIASGVAALELPTDATLVLYCRSGRRSGLATAALQKAGYRRVINGGGYGDLVTALNGDKAG
jgi:phage shock protein E